MSDIGQALRDASTEALGNVFRALPEPVMVNRFVILAEVLDNDGERRLWQITSDGMKTWETLGILACATAEESQMYVNAPGDDDD